MSSAPQRSRELYIRLFYERAGRLTDAGQDWSVEDFGGMVPSVGDMILDPGVAVGADRHDPTNREVHEVVQRWFYPGGTQNGAVVLVVRIRSLEAGESNLIRE